MIETPADDNTTHAVMAEMLSAFRPPLPGETPELLSSAELAAMMSSTLEITPPDLTKLLFSRHFHLVLTGDEWKWQLVRM